MFHVFQYWGEESEFFLVQEAISGWEGIFPSSKAYIDEGENVYHYELTYWVLTARVQGEFGAYMEETGVTARNRL